METSLCGMHTAAKQELCPDSKQSQGKVQPRSINASEVFIYTFIIPAKTSSLCALCWCSQRYHRSFGSWGGSQVLDQNWNEVSGILNMEGKTPSRVLREEAKKRKQRATEQEARQEIQRGACLMFVCVSEAKSAHFTRGLTGSMSYPDVGPDYVSLASYCSSSCVQVFTARHARVLQDITLL